VAFKKKKVKKLGSLWLPALIQMALLDSLEGLLNAEKDYKALEARDTIREYIN